jgi:hypothetical protein
LTLLFFRDRRDEEGDKRFCFLLLQFTVEKVFLVVDDDNEHASGEEVRCACLHGNALEGEDVNARIFVVTALWCRDINTTRRRRAHIFFLMETNGSKIRVK